MSSSSALKKTGALALFGGAALASAALGSLIAPRPARPGQFLWFRRLRKPPFQPPARVFAPVWSTLYPMIAASGFRTWQGAPSPARSRALAWWGVQMGLNGLWSPLFFGLRSPGAALVDSALLLASAGNYARHASRVNRSAAWLVAPYLGWLAFATALNAAIVRRN